MAVNKAARKGQRKPVRTSKGTGPRIPQDLGQLCCHPRPDRRLLPLPPKRLFLRGCKQAKDPGGRPGTHLVRERAAVRGGAGSAWGPGGAAPRPRAQPRPRCRLDGRASDARAASGCVPARARARARSFRLSARGGKMASGSGTKNLDFRRKWDKDEYEKLAEKRLTEEREKKDGKPVQPVKRELLRHRDYKVDLESKLGKTIVITKTTPQSEMGGYYCNVCDCVVKDSINFLDHINGKKHQRNLGMSMRVERSTLDQVKKRFEVNKKKMEEKQKDYDFEERMKELREEEEKAKAYKKEKQREKKRRAEEDLAFEEDDEMAAVMGFSGFGSTKKSH
ncbi:Zinc finger matrin-type protein 2 [Varanus komodoensis]|nr:Zinc finger matrin-type protein 2 [Varanus komodoensis]